MFAYCLNNPVDYSDYTGTEAVIISIILGALLKALETLFVIICVTAVILLLWGSIYKISESRERGAKDEPAVSPEDEVTPATPQPPNGNKNNNK